MSNQNAKSKVISSLFWAYCETISAQAVTFIVTLILARLLSPGDYGTIALVTVFVNIANVFVNSSFSYALIQKTDADHLDYNSVFWFNCILSVLLYSIIFCVAPYIADYYNIPILCDILRVISLKVPISAYNSIQQAKIAHDLNFRKSFYSTSVGAIVSALLGIAFALLGFGVWSLAIQSVSNTFINTIVLMFFVNWKPKCEFSMLRLRPLLRYGWKILATGLMFVGYSELSKLIIGKRFSADDLGYYDRGSLFPSFIANNVDTTINKVLFPTLSNIQDDTKKLFAYVRLATRMNSYIMTPILVVLAVTANDLVHLLLTDKWLPCVPFIYIMCISWCMQPTQSCIVQGIKAIGKSDIYLKVEIIAKILGFVYLFLAAFIVNTVIAIAISLVLAQLTSTILYAVYGRLYLKYSLGNQIKDAMTPISLCVVMVILMKTPLFLLNLENEVVSLIIQITIAIGSYLLLSKVFRIQTFAYLINNIKNRNHV